MKLKCVKNYEKGFWGFDYREEFEIGKIYTLVPAPYSIYIYSNIKNKWIDVYMMDFEQMFIPMEGEV